MYSTCTVQYSTCIPLCIGLSMLFLCLPHISTPVRNHAVTASNPSRPTIPKRGPVIFDPFQNSSLQSQKHNGNKAPLPGNRKFQRSQRDKVCHVTIQGISCDHACIVLVMLGLAREGLRPNYYLRYSVILHIMLLQFYCNRFQNLNTVLLHSLTWPLQLSQEDEITGLYLQLVDWGSSDTIINNY